MTQPIPSPDLASASRSPVGALAFLALIALIFLLPDKDQLGRPLPLSLGLGAAFGIVLQRSRFCFWCIWRDWLAERDPRGLVAILVALAIGSIGYALVFGAWIPNPFSGRLPPDAHVGPVSLTLVAGALAFGLGMAISGSCVSAHFYRLGEGAFGSIVALIGAFIGFILGFLSWNSLFLLDLHRATVIWLPGYLGIGGALLLTLVLLALLAVPLLRRPFPVEAAARSPLAAIFTNRWPPVVAGVLVGWIAVLAYFRVGPLGVTAELGSVARTAAHGASLLPDTLFGLDGFAGCVTMVKETLLSRNGVFVIGMVLAATVAATLSGGWKPQLPEVRAVPRLLLGGMLLGWGAMISLGCTVGVLLSGIMAGAASGWIFTLFAALGAYLGWKLRGGRRQ